MIGQAVPLFQAGNLLTKEMLSAMKDYAFNFGELLFQGYGNGILCGCSVSTTKSTVQLNKGMIVHEGIIYLINRPLVEKYYATDEEIIFRIQIKDEVKTQSFIYRELESVLSKEPIREREELEICRFKLQQGFRLRTDYQSFADRNTAYDTVNTIHAPFSTYGGSSISPQITKAFVDELKRLKSDNPHDLMFSMMVYQSGGFAMNHQVVNRYLEARLGEEDKVYSNLEVFHRFEKILKEHSSNRKYFSESGNYEHRVLLD